VAKTITGSHCNGYFFFRRGWVNKRWTTRSGKQRGGKPFTKTSLHRLLTNVTYLGKIKYKAEVHDGEHEAIVGGDLWQRVQSLLQHNGRTLVRNKSDALLKGLLRCVPCGCAMSPTHATKNGNKRYRYYVCLKAQKRGWQTCPSPSIPATEIERLVIEQIKCIGQEWESLPLPEQARMVRLLVERVDYDGASGKVSITLASQNTQDAA
jgi:site-specific DNA recombinase